MKRTLLRFIVSDEYGPLRRFFSREDALLFIGNNNWTLDVLPKEKKPVLDLSQFEDAPF